MKDNPPRRRHLSESERVLWREVTRGVAPLRPPAMAPPSETASGLAAEGPSAPVKSPADRGVRAKPIEASRQPPPLAPLGRRVRQRLVRSRGEIAGRLDLHGLTQHEAHDVLLRFLQNAQGRGAGIVLVITGKGRTGDSDRGVLRRQVPHWLRLPVFRELIVGFEVAHATHGGEGALYVQVRRRRA